MAMSKQYPRGHFLFVIETRVTARFFLLAAAASAAAEDDDNDAAAAVATLITVCASVARLDSLPNSQRR